jgi:heme exporter protein D
VLRAAAEELAMSTMLLFVFIAAAIALLVLAVISGRRVRERRSGRRRV